MQAAILAGGLGTRLRPLTSRVPKGMVEVDGRPFLEYEIDLLKRNGIGDIVLCLGHLGEQIERHFGGGERFGAKIRYSYDGSELLGPVGGLKMAEGLLKDEFFVTYGDAYLRMDYAGLMATLDGSGKLGVMAVFKDDGSLGKRDVAVENGFVIAYDKTGSRAGMDRINFGVTALKKEALRRVELGRYRDEESFYGELILQRQLMAFETHERFYEIGSERSLTEFRTFVSRPARTEAGQMKTIVSGLRGWNGNLLDREN